MSRFSLKNIHVPIFTEEYPCSVSWQSLAKILSTGRVFHLNNISQQPHLQARQLLLEKVTKGILH